jgi:competence protein ComEC
LSHAAFAYRWRAATLAGLVAGLALAEPIGGDAPVGIGAASALAGIVALSRPSRGGTGRGPWIALVALVAALLGLSIAESRLTAIDAGRFAADPGTYLKLRGTVVSAPRASAELTRFVLDADAGRIAVEVPTREISSPGVGKAANSAGLPHLGAIDEGRVVVAGGTVRAPAPWERSQISRLGADRVLVADSLQPTAATRGGLRGALDDIRRRAESALERGTQASGAALLRGFVLGQDDRIAEEVREDFRRSGLAHVLAVSGQNVMLLAILATPLLALAGVPLRARLVVIALIIAIYVPVAGAGASIQRAGVMGLAGLVAALASRPSARWYALGLAGAVTLAIDPRATADIGWQLSFAAVAGLLVLAPALIRVLGAGSTGVRRGLAEGAAITLAATLATAPLAAHHFGTVSLTAIPANLIALPAIAPAMWLGMLSGALGQIPGAPVEALTWLGGLCAGFIGWVAHALGPGGAQLDIPEPGPPAAVAWTLVLVGGARLVCLALERRDGLRAAPRLPRRRFALVALGAATLIVLAISIVGGGQTSSSPLLRIRLLDVGQGDAVLIEPRGHPPLLVDTGPPDADVGEQLSDHGIDELFAIAITHDDLDHSGGLADALEAVHAERLLVRDALPQSCRYLACPPATRLAAGSGFRIGPARVEVVWPPPSFPAAENPNETGLVLRVSAADFDALLTGDAEAEVASYGPGPVDLLKIAHHGSRDAGLDSLLRRTDPQLAVISVGKDNPYGHPAPETTNALAERGIPVLRTDEAGEIVIEVSRGGWNASGP